MIKNNEKENCMTNTIQHLEGKYFPVLDHGFCAVVDSMGNDKAIARAARCSYGKGTKTISDDRGLIRTLMRNSHSSPLEMCELVLHIGMPLFVSRQFVRHRTCSMNEMSARYSVVPMKFYTPERSRVKTQSQINKQGSNDQLICNKDYNSIDVDRDIAREAAVELYENSLSADMTRELARIDLPLSTYTYMYWKMDLKNLLHFLRLRLDTHAQWEIQEYARVIAGIVKEWLPITWEAFDDYILSGVSFSNQEQAVLLGLINYDPYQNFSLDDRQCHDEIIQECQDLGMSLRETTGFLTKLECMGKQFTDNIQLDLSTAKTAEHYSDRN